MTNQSPTQQTDSNLAANSAKSEINNSVNSSYPSPVKKSNPRFWTVLISTFATIFLAEMGDKTQLATLLMSAQSHAPVIVFLGAATALISTTLVGVMLGTWLAKKLSPETLDTSAAVLLLFVAILLLWDVVNNY